MIRGIIFDLDGTLVDSRLDFNAIRSEMGLLDDELILEAVDSMPAGERRNQCVEVLKRHEQRGVEVSELMPGVERLLIDLSQREVRTAVMTRNSRSATDAVLERFDLSFSHVITRDDAPPKPNPAGLLRIGSDWGFEPHEMLMVGDYLFDLQAGYAAGMGTVLYAPEQLPAFADQADFVVRDFAEFIDVIAL